MKINRYILSFFLLGSIGIALISCNNDLELFGDIIERPVVYSLLSSSDTAQYVRLERSFADPEISAVVLAKDQNQVYYADAQVDLINQSTNTRTTLTRVDAAEDGYIRKEGDFLTEPNYLYKVLSQDIDLEAGTVYSLEVIKDEKVIATSSSSILSDSRFLNPSNSGGGRISFVRGDETTIRWRRVEGASSYAISFDVEVQETDLISGDKERFSLRWNASGLNSDKGGTNTTQDLDIDGQSFFDFLQSELDPKPNVSRQLWNLDIRVISYGSEIGNYLDVINANSGITSAQEVPTYTNIEGGLGLFSSTNETMMRGLNITPATIDSLYDGVVTRDLNFTP